MEKTTRRYRGIAGSLYSDGFEFQGKLDEKKLARIYSHLGHHGNPVRHYRRLKAGSTIYGETQTDSGFVTISLYPGQEIRVRAYAWNELPKLEELRNIITKTVGETNGKKP